MSQTPAFARAAEIEAVLALMAGALRLSPNARGRLFATQPQMKAHFWRDGDDAVKGEMLSRTFAAILHFRGRAPLRPPHGSGTENGTTRDVTCPARCSPPSSASSGTPRKALLAEGWTPQFELAWAEPPAELDGYLQRTPRSDVVAPRLPAAPMNAGFVGAGQRGAAHSLREGLPCVGRYGHSTNRRLQ